MQVFRMSPRRSLPQQLPQSVPQASELLVECLQLTQHVERLVAVQRWLVGAQHDDRAAELFDACPTGGVHTR